VISQVLAIPPRRRERAIVSYLTPEEADALVAAPDRTTWHGRRDHALLLLAVQTGLRVSELTGLARHDIHLGAGPHVRCHGKGRKDRATPLTSQTVKVLRTYYGRRGSASGVRGARVVVRVNNAIPVYDLPDGAQEPGEHFVSVEAVNTGDEAVTITGWASSFPATGA
jgi:integrase